MLLAQSAQDETSRREPSAAHDGAARGGASARGAPGAPGEAGELSRDAPLFRAVDRLLRAAPRAARSGGGVWSYRATRVLPLADGPSLSSIARFGGVRVGFAAGALRRLAELVRAAPVGGGAPLADDALLLGEHVSVAEPFLMEHLAAEAGLVIGRGEPTAAAWLAERKARMRTARWRVVIALAAPGDAVPRLPLCERCFFARASRADAERALPARAAAVTFSLPCKLCGRGAAEHGGAPHAAGMRGARRAAASATERLLAVLARPRWLPVCLVEFEMARTALED